MRTEVTGQVNFDSHISGTLVGAVALVNAVSPGMRGGRPVAKPDGPALAEAVTAAIREGSPSANPISVAGAEQLAGWAARLRSVVEHVEHDRVDDACAELNGVLRDTGAVPTLSRHDGEPWHLHYHRPDAGEAESWAAPMATALAVLLGNPAVDRLGLCSAPACDRVYVDTSRNGTRRFCSMACQSRVKAAAYRARRAR
jgi:predicted RNA-binding Zn ribbon-like protein